MGVMVDDSAHTARLSCDGSYTCFSFGPYRIRFRTSRSLRRYLSVKSWNRGYIVVEAEYDGQGNPVEEYIDLVPILENLYLDADSVLAPIEEVLVA